MSKRAVNIFIDLDDVVADWLGWASSVLEKPIFRDGDKLPAEIWSLVSVYDRMYRDLPVRNGGQELVNWCTTNTDSNVFFLSALPKGNDIMWASYDKVMWGYKYFPDVPVIIAPYSHQKHQHCLPGDILIDDRKSNCDDWVAAGGLAHHYTEWEPCKEWLTFIFEGQHK